MKPMCKKVNKRLDLMNDNIKKELSFVKTICLAMDGWSGFNRSFLVVLYHWLTNNLEKHLKGRFMIFMMFWQRKSIPF